MRTKQIENLTQTEQTAIINHVIYGIGISTSLARVVDMYNIDTDNVCDIMHTVNHTRVC